MGARGWGFIVFIKDMKTETFFSVIDANAIVLYFKIGYISN